MAVVYTIDFSKVELVELVELVESCLVLEVDLSEDGYRSAVGVAERTTLEEFVVEMIPPEMSS